MRLTENPFFVLGATTRDSRRQLQETAEERKLSIDPDICSRALADLLNPGRRLFAETAWLPGISPAKAAELLASLESNPASVLALESSPPLARINLLAEAMLRQQGNSSADDASRWILALAGEFEKVKPDLARDLLNQDRLAAGIPEIPDVSGLTAPIEERRKYLRQVMLGMLERMKRETAIEATTLAVTEATASGSRQAFLLIDDLVDGYEVQMRSSLQEQGKNVESLVAALRKSLAAEPSKATLVKVVESIEAAIRRWDKVAQPIQLCARSRGTEHDETQRLGLMVRSLAVELYNKHRYLDLSNRLTHLIAEAFGEDRMLAEQATEDKIALGNIHKGMAEQAAKEAVWRKEMTWNTQWGLIFKARLGISPEAINWNGDSWRVSEIQSMSWGGIRKSINGIPTGTEFHVRFSDKSRGAHVETGDAAIFEAFTSRLWRIVGLRMLAELASRLNAGERISFGNAVLDDEGIELEKYKFFGKNPRAHFTWDQVVVWPEDGSFHIANKTDKGFKLSMSYIEAPNTHVLEAMIRAGFKAGADRLSDILA